MGLYFSLSKSLAKSGRIVCPNNCPELTKALRNKADGLKNNFYLLPKVEERRADDQMNKLAVVVKKAKINRMEDLEASRQSLGRLKTTQNVLRDLASRSERAVQHQTQTVCAIQSSLDKLNEELDPTCKDQYEAELLVIMFHKILSPNILFSSCSFFIFQSSEKDLDGSLCLQKILRTTGEYENCLKDACLSKKYFYYPTV